MAEAAALRSLREGPGEAALGVNWYLNRHAKVMVDASVTRFDGGAPSGGDREDERVLLTRVQLAL